MADHVTVDAERLRQTGRVLGEVSAALQAASGDLSDEEAALGQPDLVEAMRAFVDKWRVHRERLIESVESHQRWVNAAADGYEQMDSGMAAGLEQAGAEPR